MTRAVMLTKTRSLEVNRRRRVLLAVGLAPLWLAAADALHSLFCLVTGIPVDLAPASYVVGAVAPTAVAVAALCAAIVLCFQRWQLVVALICGAVLIPFLAFQLWRYSYIGERVGYSIFLGAAIFVVWLSASSLRRGTQATG